MSQSRNYKDNRWLKNCGLCFILIGLIFFAIYLFSIESTETERDYLKEKAIVTGNTVSDNDSKEVLAKEDTAESKKEKDKKTGKKKEEQPETAANEYILDLSVLHQENPHLYGWLYIPDTNIDYPVMYTPDDEEYYLRRDFAGKYSFSGTLFCNKATKPKKDYGNTVIYGHNMRTGTMFQNLTKYGDHEFFDSHNSFWFSVYKEKEGVTDTGLYDVIAVIYTDVNEGCFKYWQISTEEESFNEYIAFLREYSIYDTEGLNSLKYGDRIITLSTCVYHTRNGRLLIVGKRECL